MYVKLYQSLDVQIDNKFEVYFDHNELVDPEKVLQPIDNMNVGETMQAKIQTERMEKVQEIFNFLSIASCYSMRSKSFYLLQNNAKLALNIMKTEMITPSDHKEKEMFQYVTQISENLNDMLLAMKTKTEESGPSTSDRMRSIDSIRIEEQKQGDVSQADQPATKHYLLDTNLTKDFWFHKDADLDIRTIADVLSYSMKTLTVESKWNVVVELTKHFCNVTTHYFSL